MITRRTLLAAMLGPTLLGGVMYRSEDLAPLIAPDTGEPGAVRAGQGVVLEWDATTGENVIRYRGTDLHDLPIVASNSEVAQIRPGDVVMLHLIGAAGASTAYVVGRVTRPGTPEAASALQLATQAAAVLTDESTTSTSYTDLATVGPEVVVTIGPTGRALVTVSAWAQGAVGLAGNTVTGGAMSFQVTDAVGTVVLSASDAWAALFRVNSAASGGPGVGAMVFDQTISNTIIVGGLPQGSCKFTARYRAELGSAGCRFQVRHINVVPL